MNSLTRPLSHPSHWRCVATPVAGGNKMFLTSTTAPASRQPLLVLPCPRNSLHLSMSFDKMRDSYAFVPSHLFHTGRMLEVEHKFKTGLKDCYALLGVEHDCEDQVLKDAYLEKAKAYHPDSGSSTSDPYKFSQVKDAYKAVLEHRKGRELKEDEEKEAEVIFDIKHTAPQHRQYLEFEGVGFGTPSQRQRQYQQIRVMRVTENVFQHRIQQLAAETEDALVVKDKQQAKKAIISNAIERIVEDMIQESMKRGDFNNLPGQGQPLAHQAHNPFVDITTHNINKILVNNGFAPEWIMLQSEIRKDIDLARQTMAVIYSKVGNKTRTAHETKTWKASINKFNQQISDVNDKIHKFNLIVPFLNKQLMPYKAERELKKVLDNVEEYLPTETEVCFELDVSAREMPIASSSSSFTVASSQNANIDWSQVWQDIKKVFKSSKNAEVKT